MHLKPLEVDFLLIIGMPMSVYILKRTRGYTWYRLSVVWMPVPLPQEARMLLHLPPRMHSRLQIRLELKPGSNPEGGDLHRRSRGLVVYFLQYWNGNQGCIFFPWPQANKGLCLSHYITGSLKTRSGSGVYSTNSSDPSTTSACSYVNPSL